MDNGILTQPSSYSVDETVSRVQALLTARGIKLFCLIDHSGEAHNAGLEMPTTKLLIFGAPRTGTPMMLATPSIALDLPLKMLIAQTVSGTVEISWNSPSWLRARHELPEAFLSNLAAVEMLASAAGNAAVP